MEVKGNNLRSKSSIHDRNFRKFWKYFFCLVFVGLPFFKILKALHKFELKNLTVEISVSMVIVLRKFIIFGNLVFKYDLWQMTNEMALNKKKKASKRNAKELRWSH